MTGPAWYVKWERDESARGQDGVTYVFRLRIGDQVSEHHVKCGRTTIQQFLNTLPGSAKPKWEEDGEEEATRLAALALCATRIKDFRSADGLPSDSLSVYNASTKIGLKDAKKLRDGEEINLDR